jgi:thioredoxin-related protein
VVVIIVIVALLPRGKELAPDFVLLDTEGATTRSSDYRGSFLVLDLMWTKCSWCQRFTREALVPLYPAWESRVRFLSVDLNRDGDSVEVGNARILAFKAEFGATWQYALDTDGLAERTGVTGTPTTLLIDREGYTVYRHDGYESVDDFRSQLERFVGG